MQNQYPSYPPQNPMYNQSIIQKNYFVMRFWIIFGLFFSLNFFIPYVFFAYVIICCYNTYKILVKVGKISHQTYHLNLKTFLNRWLIAIFLMGSSVLFSLIYIVRISDFLNSISVSLENIGVTNLPQTPSILFIALIAFVVGYLLIIINEGLMYKFLDKFESNQQITPNGFYNRFIISLIFQFVWLPLAIYALSSGNIINLFFTCILGAICYLIGRILNLINDYKLCYKMDILQI
ncbi:putative membrane protein [Candidatus Phytoplasma solani]|uniref:hypothetical protein n=1 Tax=Candidatus Phytoplasma solani TaxID=69896 RepID=UPI0032DB2909